MNFKDLKQLCLSHGFTNVVPLACDTIELKPEVRQMCASDSCHKYNKCWSCPPGCGTLEECEHHGRAERQVLRYLDGILAGRWSGHGHPLRQRRSERGHLHRRKGANELCRSEQHAQQAIGRLRRIGRIGRHARHRQSL